jgi:6-phosphogluconolactonase (cycloisomerase 2 family)
MGTRFRFLAGIVVPVLLVGLSACNNGNSGSSTGTGALFVANQGDSTVTSFSIDLGTGGLSPNGGSIAAGSVPSAMILAPSGAVLFIANSGSNNISAYTVKTDGTLTPAGSTQAAGTTPVGMAMDSAGHFLFVANQGSQIDPNSGTVSVFAVSNSSLAEVPGSPFVVATPSAPGGTGPSGVAVTPDGKFLYVSNQFDSTVSEFSVDAAGVLTRGPVVAVGTTPATLAITADGGFLYVANASNISGFAICGQVLTSCSDPNSPDGSLTVVDGSPFSSGVNPVALVAAPSGKFLFAVNRQSNQISQYKVSTGSGVLTANTQAVISTGLTPVGGTIRVGTTTDTTTGGVTDYLYVPNLGSSSVSVYSFDSTVGLLGLVGGPVAVTGGQPGAVAAE